MTEAEKNSVSHLFIRRQKRKWSYNLRLPFTDLELFTLPLLRWAQLNLKRGRLAVNFSDIDYLEKGNCHIKH